MKEFDPTRFAQGSEARRRMIEANLAAWTSGDLKVRPSDGLTEATFAKETLFDGRQEAANLTDSAGQIVLFATLWERFKKVAQWAHGKKLELAAAPALLLAVIGAACEGVGAKPQEPSKPDPQEPKVERPIDKPEGLILPLMSTRSSSEPVYYTGGPHFDGLTGGVRAAIDLAGKNAVKCPGGEVSKEMAAIAAASGKVTTVGKEKDPTDKNHSIVELELADGRILGYMHLANIKVSTGQEVRQGDILGLLSCEFPPEGATSGQHLHFYLKTKDGKYFAIKGIVLGGWQFAESSGNYQGTAIKGGQVRVANSVRCGPDRYLEEPLCNGQRNDLTDDGEAPPTPTKTPTATNTPFRPSPGPKPLPVTLTPTPTTTAAATATREAVAACNPTEVERLGFYCSPEAAVEAHLKGQKVKFDEKCVPERGDSCGGWIETKGNYRLYYVSAAPDFLLRLSVENTVNGWRVAATAFRGWPAPFEAPVKEMFVNIVDQRPVSFGIGQADLLKGGGVRLRIYFANDSGRTIPWTSDVGNTNIYVVDEKGVRYNSLQVGGRFAQDFPQGLPNGQRWLGYHLFGVPVGAKMITLYYPGRVPLTIDLTK